MCGDSANHEQIEKLMDGKKASMVFTDPPYNVNYGATMKDKLRHKVSSENAGRKILNDHFETKQEFYQFLYNSISGIRPFVIGDLYICMSSSELDTLQRAFRDCGGHFSTFIIWVKNSFTIGRSNYQRQYEPILYGWFDKSSHFWSGIRNLSDVIRSDDYKIDEDGVVWLKAEGIPTDIWDVPRPVKSKDHPTMKPIKLCSRGIVNSSKRDDIVLDIFGGSGSTLIACEQTKRICYMSELDPKYVDVIRRRYWKFVTESEEGWENGTPKI
jgi:DNA modification methylase